MVRNNSNQEEVKNRAVREKSMNSMKRMDTIFIISILIIPIIHWAVSWLYLNIQSIIMAFQLPDGQFTMLNFEVLFSKIGDPKSDLILSLKNTFMWFIFNNGLMFPLTIVLNYFFYKKMPGTNVFRILLYIPGLLSGVAVSSMINRFVLPSGPLGILLTNLGMKDVPLFFADERYANNAMLIYCFWLGWSGNMLLLGGTFARVPQEVLEAAKLDGCSPVRELIQLIIPMISSTLITLIILNMTGIFSATGPLILFTEGEYGTMTLSYWIFESVRYTGASTYNTVAATGLFFTCIAVPVILTIRWLLEKIPVVEY